MTRQLQQQIEQLREALLSVVEDERVPACATCPLPDCPHKAQLKRTITEVIDVLEETKNAFKSKRLGVMRERLIKVLAECD